MVDELESLPKNKPINKKILFKYYNEGLLTFHPCNIAKKFGSIKNACEEAGILCGALYGKDLYEKRNVI